MADYLTADELMQATSARELAQVASPRDLPPCTAGTLRTLIGGGDIAGQPDAAAATAAHARIAAIITSATELVDNFLRGRYPVPLDNPPSTIREIMVRVTRYLLHDERATSEIRDRYKEAMAWLQAIADGTMNLDVPGIDPGTVGAADVYVSHETIYSVCSTKDFARGIP